MISKLDPSKAHELTQLAYRSKAHWGYNYAQMKGWIDDLNVTSSYFEKFEVHGYSINRQILGFYSYQVQGTQVYMDMLFVDPDYFKRGIGRQLVQHLLSLCTPLDLNEISLHADPHAVEFYKCMGFTVTGSKPSNISGRHLPIMTYFL